MQLVIRDAIRDMKRILSGILLNTGVLGLDAMDFRI